MIRLQPRDCLAYPNSGKLVVSDLADHTSIHAMTATVALQVNERGFLIVRDQQALHLIPIPV